MNLLEAATREIDEEFDETPQAITRFETREEVEARRLDWPNTLKQRRQALENQQWALYIRLKEQFKDKE